LCFKFKTGRFVWNQHKHFLTNDSKKGIPLIWANNITADGLNFPLLRAKRPQYVSIKNYDLGPAVVVNRVTGTVGSGKLKAALIPKGMKFIGENHVNVIFPPSKDKGKITLENLMAQLRSKEKLKLIQALTGNTQISKNELEHLFPIDIGEDF
jgi:adenine-specific DNA-methyltransferase